jgi:NAD(P)-dependent dehydrogenase (short-subunit alcohol dehydrogenase family)
MRVVVVGATGTVGKAVVDALRSRHEIVPVARTHGEQRVDISKRESVQKLFDAIGRFDALVCAAGEASYKPLEELTDADFQLGLSSKLMGQVHLVLLGLRHARDGGSFTLTSGVLASEPMPGSAAISPVNAAVEAFARAAALEMPRGIRINVVSPPWVSETLAAMGRDPGGGLPAARVAAAYVESVEGRRNGEILDARKFR